MTLRWVLASLHLLALAIGMGAVWSRSRALRGEPGAADVQRALTADGWWAVAAVLWLSTGLWRLLAGTEKATSYYTANHWFMAKMGFFVLIVLLEIWPAMTLMRWRPAIRHGAMPDLRPARAIASISTVQAALVAIMIGLATAMARGYGMEE